MSEFFSSALNIFGVIMAFSILIFVHELGHFLAALYAGVRVDKFMIGFDVWGAGLKFKRGQTEYGIGLLPLGGYVKLAGQSDLPGEEELTGAPDELMSKSVGARALVFVAGVTMNFIFGFIFLVMAQMYGVPRLQSVIGYAFENGPAYQAGLRPGDRIVAVDGRPAKWFMDDVQQAVVMSDGKPLDITYERTGEDGKKVENTVRVKPTKSYSYRGNPYVIDIDPEISREVSSFKGDESFFEYDKLKENIERGDKIMAVNGKKIPDDNSGGMIRSITKNMAGQSVELTIEKKDGTQKTVTARVYPIAESLFDFGVRYAIGINEVAEGSAAAKAGLKAGDTIGTIDGKPFDNPRIDQIISAIKASCLTKVTATIMRDDEEMKVELTPASMQSDIRVEAGTDTLLGILAEPMPGSGYRVDNVLPRGPSEGILQAGDEIIALGDNEIDITVSLAEQVDKASGRPVTLGILRDGKEQEIQIKAEVDPAVGIPRIGVVLSENQKIYKVADGSLAASLGLTRGDSITGIKYSYDLKKTTLTWVSEGGNKSEKEFDTPEEVIADPMKHGVTGDLLLALRSNFVLDKADSFLAACKSAVPTFIDKTLFIYKSFSVLATGKMNIKAAGGPIMIFRVMYGYAGLGLGKLLDITAFISINLAVLNLMPFPVLDGGHLLFLLIELIRGKKPSPKVREVAQYIGFFCLLGLMLLVTFFDISSTWFGG